MRRAVVDHWWMREGSCVSEPDLPWVNDPALLGPADVDLLASICDACPVLLPCGAYARDAGITAGFWAGRLRSPDRTSVQLDLLDDLDQHEARRVSA